MTSVVISTPRPVWSLRGKLLEGPVWIERDAALWFVDIKLRKIHRYDPASTSRSSWDAPEQIGFCLPAAGGKFVAGLQSGLALFSPESGAFEHLVDPEPGLPGNRLNDATVDPTGSLWFGTMDDAEQGVTGRIWRLGPEAICQAMTDPVPISNGPAVSPDGRTLYHVDTLGGTIYAATIEKDRLVGQRIFASIANAQGYPDGPAVDAEGCLWIGLYNGGGVARYAPTGELLETVGFPVSAVTKLAFGGHDLQTVFATTASKHLDPAGLAREPHAGDLFTFRVSTPGIAGHEVLCGL